MNMKMLIKTYMMMKMKMGRGEDESGDVQKNDGKYGNGDVNHSAGTAAD